MICYMSKIKSWDHTWEHPTEYQMEKVRADVRATREAKPEDFPIPDGENPGSITMRLWAARRKQKERFKIN